MLSEILMAMLYIFWDYQPEILIFSLLSTYRLIKTFERPRLYITLNCYYQKKLIPKIRIYWLFQNFLDEFHTYWKILTKSIELVDQMHLSPELRIFQEGRQTDEPPFKKWKKYRSLRKNVGEYATFLINSNAFTFTFYYFFRIILS